LGISIRPTRSIPSDRFLLKLALRPLVGDVGFGAEKNPFANSCLWPKLNHFPEAIGSNKVITRSQLALSPSLNKQSQGISEFMNAILTEG
jgi:hypothetical protein